MEQYREFLLAGVVMKQQLSGQQTAETFSLFENRSNGRSRTPIHTHSNEDETLYVISGEMRASIGGVERTVKAGESVFLPRGVAHQLGNESDAPAHYLLLCTPAGFEGFLQEGGRELLPGETPRPPTVTEIERMKAAAPRSGITLLAEWPHADSTIGCEKSS